MEIIRKSKDILERVKRLSLFRYLESSDFGEVEKYINIIRYKKGEDIVREGERPGGIFFIISGKCKILKGNAEIAEIGEEDFFGEGEILLQTPASATVKADSEEVEVIYVIRGGIEQLERIAPKFTTILYKTIAKIELERLISLDNEFIKVMGKLEAQKREEIKKARGKIFGAKE